MVKAKGRGERIVGLEDKRKAPVSSGVLDIIMKKIIKGSQILDKTVRIKRQVYNALDIALEWDKLSLITHQLCSSPAALHCKPLPHHREPCCLFELL